MAHPGKKKWGKYVRGEFYSWIILTFAAVVMAGILGAVIAAGLITRKKKKYYMSTGFHAGSQLGAVYARPPETVQDTQTSVLGESPAETGCLDTGFACPCAMLIRRKTGERSDVKRPLLQGRRILSDRPEFHKRDLSEREEDRIRTGSAVKAGGPDKTGG